ncbi:secreted RxLR effector protein 161-like [Ziziphus jujuba]|uniref:Secreted RxLR effector protein 161-like n=1 Tax=Ziziphus jujuba TaxID=326968 RepID=A0ABM3I095_ZIZJJ|nr:secreted RxLR effector protein 161-like [Ziziphus jujuba]
MGIERVESLEGPELEDLPVEQVFAELELLWICHRNGQADEKFMENPYSNHLEAAKRLLRYVKRTIDYGIFYQANLPINLIGYTDSDLAGSIDDNKSVAGYVFNIGSGVISWMLKKQQVVALLTTEVE